MYVAQIRGPFSTSTPSCGKLSVQIFQASSFVFFFFVGMEQPRVLILGHSFIRRLRDFIIRNSPTYNLNLNINTPVTIHWHGVGGRTIDKVRRFDLTEVERFKPDVVILQIGTNDLTRRRSSPASVGSAIEDLVCLLHNEYGVRLVCVGQTVKRHPVGTFNANVQILAQYLQGVLEPLPFAIYWTHRGFWRASRSYLSYDGVHLNTEGQHKLYRSVRGAVLHCLKRITT